jgi:Putative zincin peptidase
MLFRLGPPPNSLSDAELASGEWQRLPYPPLWALRVMSFPLGIVTALPVFFLWVLLTPRFDVSSSGPGYRFIVAYVLIELAGAFLQMSAHPRRGLSTQTFLGFWPSRLLLYCACLSKATKRNAIAASLLPFLVLAVLPLLIAAVLHISSGWLIFCSCLAAASFGANVVLALPMWWLPSGCVIAGRGFQPYWRLSQQT